MFSTLCCADNDVSEHSHFCNEQVNHLITFTKILLPLPFKSLSLVGPKSAAWTYFQVRGTKKKSV